MINTQEYIITELKKTLQKMIILSEKNLNNLIYIVVGIICSKSVVISNIAEELKDDFSKGTESSKIKRIYRFFINKSFNAETIYYMFSIKLIEKYTAKTTDIKQYIIFDHTTITDKFTILMFSLKVGKRSVPLWFKIFKYDDKNNKNFEHVKKGLITLHTILKKYNFEIIILADRGFKSVDLFKFIDEDLKWKYCIRCTRDVMFCTENNNDMKKLKDIIVLKNKTKYFKNIKLTAQKYVCNLAVCKAEDKEDTWYIIHNLNDNQAIREYKKRCI